MQIETVIQDETPYLITYYIFTCIFFLTFVVSVTALYSKRHLPYAAKRRIELNLSFSIMHALLLLRTLNYGLEDITRSNLRGSVVGLIIDFWIISSLSMAISAMQVVTLINEAHINQLLLNVSTRKEFREKGNQPQKTYFKKIDFWILKVFFAFRQKKHVFGLEKKKVLDFSNSGVFRSILIVSSVLTVLGIIFSVSLLYFMDWNIARMRENWYILWIWVILTSLSYFLSYAFYVWRAKHIKDPYFILKEHKLRSAVVFILAPFPIIEAFSPPFAEAIRQFGFNSVLALTLIFFLLEIIPLALGGYFFYTMGRRIGNLAVDPASFTTMFNDKHMWNEFKKLLAKDFCMENAFFLEEYDRIFHKEQYTILKSNATGSDTEFYSVYPTEKGSSTIFVVCNNASDLYEVFLKSDSMYELNVSYKVKNALATKANSKELVIEDFQQVHAEVVNSLLTNTFPRFVSSQKQKLQA